jgi:hypothetical protein
MRRCNSGREAFADTHVVYMNLFLVWYIEFIAFPKFVQTFQIRSIEVGPCAVSYPEAADEKISYQESFLVQVSRWIMSTPPFVCLLFNSEDGGRRIFETSVNFYQTL